MFVRLIVSPFTYSAIALLVSVSLLIPLALEVFD